MNKSNEISEYNAQNLPEIGEEYEFSNDRKDWFKFHMGSLRYTESGWRWYPNHTLRVFKYCRHIQKPEESEDDKILKATIGHIFASGANEIRIFEMVKRHIEFLGRDNKESELLKEACDLISDLMDIQNGCPLPTYQKDFDETNAKARSFLTKVKENK